MPNWFYNVLINIFEFYQLNKKQTNDKIKKEPASWLKSECWSNSDAVGLSLAFLW